jgi:hypothetical protein
MIAPATGEVGFQDGLVIMAHCRVRPLSDARGDGRPRALQAPRWTCHPLGTHPSQHGLFRVEVVAGPEARVHLVSLAHVHPFYEKRTPEDSERRAYHEGIIAADLKGQREFPWGQVFCKLDPVKNEDWLVVAYTQGPHVPKSSRAVLGQLIEREKATEQ